MGTTYITVSIRNPMERERVWTGEFMIDTKAADTLVPKQRLESIGIVPRAQRTFALADGNKTRLDIAGGQIEFLEESTFGTVVFGEENAEPLLGFTALASVGIEVNPHNHTLKKLPAIRLPGFRPL